MSRVDRLVLALALACSAPGAAHATEGWQLQYRCTVADPWQDLELRSLDCSGRFPMTPPAPSGETQRFSSFLPQRLTLSRAWPAPWWRVRSTGEAFPQVVALDGDACATWATGRYPWRGRGLAYARAECRLGRVAFGLYQDWLGRDDEVASARLITRLALVPNLGLNTNPDAPPSIAPVLARDSPTEPGDY